MQIYDKSLSFYKVLFFLLPLLLENYFLKMKKALFFCLLLCALNPIAQAFSFSDSVRVSLITCSPGPAVYARFGHTAIRVYDPINNIDWAFNYGMFNFNTENFYFKFVSGQTDYELAIQNFSHFLFEYVMRNSWVWEQVLNLTLDEKRELIDLLMINYSPENRIYRYNFVFDNCATRPRDIIMQSLNGSLNFTARETPKTFREWLKPYIGENTWLRFGIDMIFGNSADVVATRMESMFLPEVLMAEFQMAEIVSFDGSVRPLVSEKNILAAKQPEKEKELFFLFTPFAVSMFLLLLGFVFLYKSRKFHKFYKTFDSVLFVLLGLIGCIIVFLDYFSLHPLVKNNANILWINPLFLFIGIAQWFKALRLVTFFAVVLSAILILIALFLYVLNIVYSNIAFIPLALLLFLRMVNYIRVRLKKGIKIGNKTMRISLWK